MKHVIWNYRIQKNGGEMPFFGNSVNLIVHTMSSFDTRLLKQSISMFFIWHFSVVNKEELARFVRSLKVLEHCIQPFLDHCDTDNDNKISAEEWGICLGLDKGRIILFSPTKIFIWVFLSRWYGFLENILYTIKTSKLVSYENSTAVWQDACVCVCVWL